MDYTQADELVTQLAAGFETLQDEYLKLFGQHQALERKLVTAREQYNTLAKLCGSGKITTPPLSLASSPTRRPRDMASAPTVSDVLLDGGTEEQLDAARLVRAADIASKALRQGLPGPAGGTANGVKIWSGRSADRLEGGGSLMPSISESPLEQDFTIEGKPSKLGCPFASMANKRLSSHAASVLSRYQDNGSAAPSTTMTSVSRVNGRNSFARRSDRRPSFADPIKAEICGLSDHDQESPRSERAAAEYLEKQDSAETGVCPIRFLDQHSPEEVATYFERHKHELPRSHELCVKRYQSNEKQIQELDAKYGTIVSMIQGLGSKHKDMLPREPEEGEAAESRKGDGKIRRWASSVTAESAGGEDDHKEERQPHFERPLHDIRVGESPSRPWGIRVPADYNEEAGLEPAVAGRAPNVKTATETSAKCPFGFGNVEVASQPPMQNTEPNFVAPNVVAQEKDGGARMTFTGPVFFGYSADDAAKILNARR